MGLTAFSQLEDIDRAELVAIFLTQQRIDKVAEHLMRGSGGMGGSADIPGDHD